MAVEVELGKIYGTMVWKWPHQGRGEDGEKI
jgi:hypothetical protein